MQTAQEGMIKTYDRFHETRQGFRFTISEPARQEVLQRLLKLNHKRCAEKVKQGLHGKKGGERRVVRRVLVVAGKRLAVGERERQ
jgi:hypothetical protein